MLNVDVLQVALSSIVILWLLISFFVLPNLREVTKHDT